MWVRVCICLCLLLRWLVGFDACLKLWVFVWSSHTSGPGSQPFGSLLPLLRALALLRPSVLWWRSGLAGRSLCLQRLPTHVHLFPSAVSSLRDQRTPSAEFEYANTVLTVSRLHRPSQLVHQQQPEPAIHPTSSSPTTAAEHPALARPNGLCCSTRLEAQG